MTPSLQFRLSAWLSGVILVFALAAGIFSFVSAFQEAHELQDDTLRQLALLINRQPLPAPRPDVAVFDPESRVIVQLLPPSRTKVTATKGELPDLPANLPEGIQTVMVDDQSWRLFVNTRSSGLRVAVGQQTAVRDEIARDSALRTLMPLVLLIPVLLLLVGGLTRKMFGPLNRLSADLDRRAEQDVRAITETDLPSEIRPFVVAINRLLSRVAQSVAMQRRFVADAAHELRSPLTALSLQAERLEAAAMSLQARQRLDTLRKGIQRTRGLLEQLLMLARVQESPRQQAEILSVQQVFRQVLEDLLPLAEAKHIDLGVVGETDAQVVAPAIDLNTLVKNLVDNAIRYTPDGGQVDLSVRTRNGRVILQVEDTGPGIPVTERERVFDPFYRVLGNEEVGSGLGLSIVQSIAQRLGAVVVLGSSGKQPDDTGLRVTVTFAAVTNAAQG